MIEATCFGVQNFSHFCSAALAFSDSKATTSCLTLKRITNQQAKPRQSAAAVPEQPPLDLLLIPVGVSTGDFGGGPGVQIRNMVAALKPLFDKAALAHESEFKNLSKLDGYRDRFHQMTRNGQGR